MSGGWPAAGQSDLERAWGDPAPSGLSAALATRRAAGLPIVDLIGAPAWAHGLACPPDLLADIAAEAVRASAEYEPDPRGRRAARTAVAAYHGGGVSPDDVLLTPGTSLAYLYAFRALAGAGAEALVPCPTYPLFDDLARVAGVELRRYHLTPPAAGGGGAGTGDSHWSIDPDEIAFQLTPRTRLLCVVSPHNPTGSVASAAELAAIGRIAEAHPGGLTVVFDEVFREWTHGQLAVPRPSECGVALSITLNGLSKMLSLPGWKAGWMVLEGSDMAWRRRAMATLEYFSDTLLPVHEMTQAALPRLLTDGRAPMTAIAAGISARMKAMARDWHEAGGSSVSVPEAGPYLALPATTNAADEEIMAVGLIRDHGIATHPGSLYGLPPGHLVATCIHAPAEALLTVAGAVTSGPANDLDAVSLTQL